MDDEGWIAQALAEAEAAAARGEVPVGAVLVSGEGEVRYLTALRAILSTEKSLAGV